MNELPKELGKSPIQRIIKFYSVIFARHYGFQPKILNWGAVGKLYKNLLQYYTENQIALLIALHFEWRGADGTDSFTHQRLQNACFPLEWLPRNANAYEAYIRNVLNIDLDNPKSIEQKVGQHLKG